MRQVLFEFPFLGLKVFGYGLMLFFAFLASTHLAARRAEREKLNPELVYDLALWVFIGGIVGARLFYVGQYWGKQIHSVGEIFQIWKGGIVLYGSIIGGTLTFFGYRLLRPFPIRPMLDAVAPSIALGIAIGRLGCFLNGCCWGDVCQLPWAVEFPMGSPPWNAEVERLQIPANAPHSLPLHPTQIYSTIDGLVLMVLLNAYYPLRRRDGEVMGLLMVTYPITRFLVEHLRSDEGVYIAGMTISQTVSVGLLAGGLAFWAYLLRTPRVRFADGAGGSPLSTTNAVPAT